MWAIKSRSADAIIDREQAAATPASRSSGLGGVVEDIGLAEKLSLTYSKPQILDMYLNSVSYRNGYWGQTAAAERDFGVSPRRLTLAEASMLAELPQAPSAYDPLRDLALAKLRQRHVLGQLVVNKVLTKSQATRCSSNLAVAEGGS